MLGDPEQDGLVRHCRHQDNGKELVRNKWKDCGKKEDTGELLVYPSV